MKKIFLTILLFLFGLQVSFAAIAFDAKTAATTSGTASLTFSHTTSGTNRFLIVIAAANTGFTTTGVTYAGTNMLLVAKITDSAGPTQSMWYLANPASGANNVVITNSGSVTAGSAVSYTGVDQTNPINASSTQNLNNTTTHFTATTTSTVDQSWFIASSRTGAGNTLTGDSGTTVRNQPELTFFGSGAVWDSNSAQPTGSYTLGVTSTSQLFGGAIMIAISPVATSGATRSGIGFFNFFSW